MAHAAPRSEGDDRADKKKSWVRGRILGSGSYGKVHMGIDVLNGEILAVKSAGAADTQTDSKNVADIVALENEIAIMKEINHPKIVRYLGSDWSLENGQKVRNLLMEHLPGGSLADIIRDLGGKLEESLIRKYTRDMVLGLAHLHSLNVVHGDIKGQNILIGQGSAKIADFGTAWKLTPDSDDSLTSTPNGDVIENVTLPTENLTESASMTDYSTDSATDAAADLVHFGSVRRNLNEFQYETHRKVPSTETGKANGTVNGTVNRTRNTAKSSARSGISGTIAYMSPEAAKEESVSGTKTDIWSLGCTVFEMVTGVAPWSEIKGGGFAILYAISCTRKLPQMPSGTSAALADFLAACLNRDAAKRPSAVQLLKHPFLFQNVESQNPKCFHSERSPNFDSRKVEIFHSRKISPLCISLPPAPESQRLCHAARVLPALTPTSPSFAPTSPSLPPPSPTLPSPTTSLPPPSPARAFVSRRPSSFLSPSPSLSLSPSPSLSSCSWSPWSSSFDLDPRSFSPSLPSLPLDHPSVSNFSLEKPEISENNKSNVSNPQKFYHFSIHKGKGSLAEFRSTKESSASFSEIEEKYKKRLLAKAREAGGPNAETETGGAGDAAGHQKHAKEPEFPEGRNVTRQEQVLDFSSLHFPGPVVSAPGPLPACPLSTARCDATHGPHPLASETGNGTETGSGSNKRRRTENGTERRTGHGTGGNEGDQTETRKECTRDEDRKMGFYSSFGNVEDGGQPRKWIVVRSPKLQPSSPPLPRSPPLSPSPSFSLASQGDMLL